MFLRCGAVGWKLETLYVFQKTEIELELNLSVEACYHQSDANRGPQSGGQEKERLALGQ